MASRAVTFELPEEILELVGTAAHAAEKARTALLMDLLREGSISQGQAARVLGATRWELIDLMVEHGVTSGPESADELQREFASAREALRHQ